MAPAPEGTDPPEIQTVALKVSIHCEGCKKKVKKVLQRVEGVGHIDIDSKQNKVTVTGSANAESLIQKLGKYGKQAALWPDTKPSAAGKSCGELKEDGKEKAAAASTAIATPPETEQQPTTEKKQQAEEAKLAPPPPTETTKTTPTVPATAASGDVSASKDNIDAPELNPSEAPAKSEKPVCAADSENSKKKGKKVEITGDESAVSDTDESAARAATVAAMNPPTPHPFPAHPLSSYTMSYNTVRRPSISYSHYAPSPAIPSSYTTYSDHPPPAALPSSYATYSNYPPPAPSMPSSYTTYSSYTSVPSYPPENYSTDSYYGSMEAPPASEGSYDMFNDENPNACNLM